MSLHKQNVPMSARPSIQRAREQAVDIDIHGLIGIRLINPPPLAVAAVKEHLGLLQGSLLRQPDISIRFVNRIEVPRLRILGQDQYGFTDDEFFILHGAPSGAKTSIPFDRVGSKCEIVTDRADFDTQLLIDMIKVTALKKGCAPVHGCGLEFKGQGILLSSWGKGGKTTALLGFVSMGAKFVGDDLILLSGDGRTMYGIPSPMGVSHRHLRALPSLRLKLRSLERLRLEATRGVEGASRVFGGVKGDQSLVRRTLRRVLEGLERRWSVRIPPKALGNAIALITPAPDKIFILLPHEGPRVEVEAGCPSDFVGRLAYSALADQKSLREHYLAYKYAFPNRSNPLLENESGLLRDIILCALAKKDIYIIRHPYPVPFSRLYEAIAPYLAATTLEGSEGSHDLRAEHMAPGGVCAG
jgi:hypothetical protein